jgi:type VI secretion system secreted protein VgrG
MPNRRPGLEADFLLEAGTYSSKDLQVIRFEGEEALSKPFLFQLEVAMEEAEPDFDALLGQAAMLTIEGDQGTRYVCGIVSKFEQFSEPARLTQYKVDVVPKLWLLGLRHNSRIFQQMPAPDIVKKVLTDAGIPSGEFQLRLKSSYSEREYCVQYRESDLAFISRLMEEEGIYYWFEHSQNKHVLVMGDAASIHTPIDGDATVFFQSSTGQEPDVEHILKFRYAQAVRPGEVVLRDFDFKKPTLDLTAQKAADRDTALEIYDYPGEYTQPSVGAALSEVRLQELQTPRRLGNGTSNCRRLIPGFKFTLAEHPRPDLSREYLLTRVLHSGSQIQVLKEAAGAAARNEYHSDFACIPSSVQFRPQRLTPRPVLAGSQTAVVTGPKGEEIYPDEHGRVKVQFHWDREGKRDEKSSCWIRVSQTWAGPGWGAVVIPRIGQEVIVQFLEGDPDRPIITGTVYNGDNRHSASLPGSKSQSGFRSNSTPGGAGYNEFVMDDTKGNELMRVHGQFDMDTTVNHDLREHVLNNRNRDVSVNESVKVGADQTLNVGSNQKYSIGSNQTGSVGGNKSITVSGNHNETVSGAKSMNVSGTHTEDIGSSMTINVGSNLAESVALVYTENVGAAMVLNVGAAMTQSIGAAYMLSVGGLMNESVGISKSSSVGSSSSETVGGSKKVEVAASLTESVGGKHGETVGGAYALKAETVAIEASDQITLTTGSAKIVLKSGGDILIKGSNITIDGSSKIAANSDGSLILKGNSIEQN